jgi:hypothetical protein
MPRDGSLTLFDIREPTLTIICERCGRYGRHKVARLTAAHGADAKLTDLLVTLANCEKARSVSVHDRCKKSEVRGVQLPILTIPQPCCGRSRPRAYTPAAGPIFGGAAMIQDVFGTLWFITSLIVIYGMATGDLCLWRPDDSLIAARSPNARGACSRAGDA